MQAFPLAQWGGDVGAFFTFQNHPGLIWGFFLGYLALAVWYHIWVIKVEDREYTDIADRVRRGIK